MSTLSTILRTKFIPWSRQDAGERFLVAREKMRPSDLPYGMELIPHKFHSKRVIIKKKRCYNNVRNIIAEWPDAGLNELNKYALIGVLEGHIDYQLGNYKVKCGPGYFILIPPGLPLPNGSQSYVDLDKSTFCNIFTFVLHPRALEYWASHCTAEGRVRSDNHIITHPHAVSLFQLLAEEAHKENNTNPDVITKFLALFFRILQREIDKGGALALLPEDAMEKIPSLPQEDFASRLQHYIKANLRQQLTIEIVARDLYLSPAQFTRNVRKAMGKSFHEYLSQCRIEEAKQLLLHSEWSIAAISSLAGFRSASYFCTFFKQQTKLTPSEFRQKFQET